MLEEKRYIARIYLQALVRIEAQAAAAALSLGLERLAARIAAERSEIDARMAELAAGEDDPAT